MDSSGPPDSSTLLMDPYAINPGPVDPSVLYDQENHVSSAVWDGQERGVLRCHEHTSKLGEWRLTQKQIELVDQAGFGYLRLLPSISLDNPLISALVERWRKETNTFHLTVGEMTITLEDVALLLGLPIDGEPVLGVTYTSCKSVCENFLGRVPEAGYMSGGMVKLSWLKEYFIHCPSDAPLDEIERHTRAYLLYLVGSTIFSTTTGNKVPVMYLPLFEDFQKAGKYAWGAAALAFLYRALGKASLKSQNTISGSLTLLQCWSYFHLNIGLPKFYKEPVHDCFPFVLRWKGKQSAAPVKRDLVFYRKALDSLRQCDVEWLPYKNIDSTLIPEHIRSNVILGRSKTMLICFDKAERQLPDRCLRQHGMLQGIPTKVQQWERKSRGVDNGIDISEKMESEIDEWSARRINIVQHVDIIDESEYMLWYSGITRKFVGRPVSPLSQCQRTIKFRTKKKRMNSGLRDIAHIADTFSTKGLDPQQMESISKIRAIAHACLGDQVGGAMVFSAPLHVEAERKTREKQRVRRNISLKRGRKEDTIHCYTSREDQESHFHGIEVGSDQMQFCPVDSEVDHLQLGKRARKKEIPEKKTSRKHKRKDDARPCDANTQSPFDSAAGESESTQLCHDDVEFDHSIRHHVAGESETAMFYHETGESGKVEPISKTCNDEILELCQAQIYSAGEVDASKPSDVTHAVDNSDLAYVAQSSHPTSKVGKIKLSDVDAAKDDLGLSHFSGEGVIQTAKIANDSNSCDAASKADNLKLRDVCDDSNLSQFAGENSPQTAKVADDSNHSHVVGEKVPQAAVAVNVVPESSIENVEGCCQAVDAVLN